MLEKEILRAKLLGSLSLFTQFFYKKRTGRDFRISHPIGRESHHIILFKELTKCVNLENKNLVINIPPRYGKTEILIHFVAWGIAKYPDSQYMYISVSKELATKATAYIQAIMRVPEYKYLFGINIDNRSKAQNNFKTNTGAWVGSFGADGTIVGSGAGLSGVDHRFGGALIMDDMHNPKDVYHDVMRENILTAYSSTIESRVNSPSITPIIFIGQVLHEADLAMTLRSDSSFKNIILQAIDECNNALDPYIHSIDVLLKKKDKSPYIFSAQYQQNPIPAGGALFKEDYLYVLDEDPDNIVATFITSDTAETDKSYNDATVFSFWGLYKIKNFGQETDKYAIHWIDCNQIRVEPKDLRDEFMAFFNECMMYPIKPKISAIEKKSTGVTLCSVLKDLRGMQVLEINRTANSNSKSYRFVQIQEIMADKRVSIRRFSRHQKMVTDHIIKITANNSHRYDDIADTLYDAVKLALIDGTLNYLVKDKDCDEISNKLNMYSNKMKDLYNKNYSNIRR